MNKIHVEQTLMRSGLSSTHNKIPAQYNTIMLYLKTFFHLVIYSHIYN